MTNGDQGSALAQEVVLAVAREYGWPEPGYREITLADVSTQTLQEIAGTYRIGGQGLDIIVTVVDAHLRVEIGDPEEAENLQVLEIHATAEDSYIDLTDGTQFRVERDDRGAVSALQVLAGPRAVRVEGSL